MDFFASLDTPTIWHIISTPYDAAVLFAGLRATCRRMHSIIPALPRCFSSRAECVEYLFAAVRIHSTDPHYSERLLQRLANVITIRPHSIDDDIALRPMVSHPYWLTCDDKYRKIFEYGSQSGFDTANALIGKLTKHAGLCELINHQRAKHLGYLGPRENVLYACLRGFYRIRDPELFIDTMKKVKLTSDEILHTMHDWMRSETDLEQIERARMVCELLHEADVDIMLQILGPRETMARLGLDSEEALLANITDDGHSLIPPYITGFEYAIHIDAIVFYLRQLMCRSYMDYIEYDILERLADGPYFEKHVMEHLLARKLAPIRLRDISRTLQEKCVARPRMMNTVLSLMQEDERAIFEKRVAASRAQMSSDEELIT